MPDKNNKEIDIKEIVNQLRESNQHLVDLHKIIGTGKGIAATKKKVPFHTGSVEVQVVQRTQPSNPDNYAVIIDLYAQNDSRPIEHMTLINDGPGVIFFIVAYAKNELSTQEGTVNVNDQRELFNVFEVRLRVTLPKTSFRLIEGVLRTGSFSPFTKANVEIRPTVQANEELKLFDGIFDLTSPITITSPTVQTFPVLNVVPGFQPPLPPGATATLVDSSTGIPMPFLIPPGFIIELFAWFGNTSTDCTIRAWAEPVPNSAVIFGTTTFALSSVIPFSNRGTPFNFVPNVNFYSSEFADPQGAPPPGRFTLLTITNDDPFDNMIGNPFIIAILRQIT